MLEVITSAGIQHMHGITHSAVSNAVQNGRILPLYRFSFGTSKPASLYAVEDAIEAFQGQHQKHRRTSNKERDGRINNMRGFSTIAILPVTGTHLRILHDRPMIAEEA